MLRLARNRLLGVLGVPCGAFGGNPGPNKVIARWCTKRFGHSDSHAYEHGAQPLHYDRTLAQGYRLEGAPRR